MAAERVDRLAGRHIPDASGAVVAGGDEVPVVAAESDGGNLGGVAAQRQHVGVAASVQNVPFPVAQVLRAGGQELGRAAEVVRRQFALSQGDAVIVQLRFDNGPSIGRRVGPGCCRMGPCRSCLGFFLLQQEST